MPHGSQMEKLVRKQAGLKAQRGTVYCVIQHSATLRSDGKVCEERGTLRSDGKVCEERGTLRSDGKVCEERGTLRSDGKVCEERGTLSLMETFVRKEAH